MKKLAFLLLLVPLALAACGGGSQGAQADPVAYVKSAAQKTAATSEHLEMTMKTDLGSMMSMSMTGAGDFSTSPRKGSFALHTGLMGQNVEMQEIVDGTTIYVGSPLFAAATGGKKWVKVDLARLAKVKGFDPMSLMTQDPGQAIERLEGAGTVTKVGTETIDGDATTHYRVTNLDLSKLPHGGNLEKLAHPKYGPIDVWIGDSNGYLYRVVMSVAVGSGGEKALVSTTIDLSKFGEDVHVDVPPASEVADATTLPGFNG